MSARTSELWEKVVESAGQNRFDLMDELVDALLLDREFDAAVAVKRQLIDDLREEDLVESWCEARYELAVLFRNQGETTECFEVLEQLVEELTFASSGITGCAHTLFGQLNNERLAWSLAEVHFGRALDGMGLGERYDLRALAYWGLAEALFSQGKVDEASEAYEAAIDLYGSAQEQEMVLDVTFDYAESMERAGRNREARKQFEDALTLARYLALADLEQSSLHSLARLHLAWSEFAVAEKLLRTVVAMKANASQRLEGVSALITLAALRRSQGRFADADEFDRQAKVIGRSLGV